MEQTQQKRINEQLQLLLDNFQLVNHSLCSHNCGVDQDVITARKTHSANLIQLLAQMLNSLQIIVLLNLQGKRGIPATRTTELYSTYSSLLLLSPTRIAVIVLHGP